MRLAGTQRRGGEMSEALLDVPCRGTCRPSCAGMSEGSVMSVVCCIIGSVFMSERAAGRPDLVCTA